MATSKLISLLILLHARGLGRVGIGKLIDYYKTPENVVNTGWDPKKRRLLDKWTVGNWEKDLEAAEKEGVRLISYQDTEYPSRLLNLPDFPLVLYVKGHLPPKNMESIALIGTRQATLYGKQNAENIGRELAEAGICVVSGLARGIDTAAHEGALKGGGICVAFLGCGLGHIYPQENRLLSDQIAQTGALVSEFPMELRPAKGLFPRRNRLVSGMAIAVCLIESPLTGGGMLTMQLAENQKKVRFALPGRVDWPSFAGNHFLLKTQKAHLAENGIDLLNILNIPKNQLFKNSPLPSLSPEESALLLKMPPQEKTIEELVLLTQLPIMQLNVLLTRLVLKKIIKEFPGKIYKKN
jgi:DNA processing protein